MKGETARYIEIEADVRYWEDATVNGVQEDDDNPTIHGAEDGCWKVRIDLEDGSIVGWPEGVAASVHYKVCDAGEYWLQNEKGERIAKSKGYYVPDGLCYGDNGFGDYIIFSIGGDGKIADYERPYFDDERWEPVEEPPQ